MGRYAILGLLVLVSLLFYPVVKMFVIPVVLAAAFTTLFFPLYLVLLKFLRGNKPLSSLFSCLLLFLCLVVPSYVVMHLIVRELFDFYQSAEPFIKDLLQNRGQSGIAEKIRSILPGEAVRYLDANFAGMVTSSVKTLLGFTSKAINVTSTGFFGFFLTLIVMFFTMFYFFIDGQKLIKKIKYLSPIRDEYEELIFSRFLLISRATVMGTVVIGIVQGTLGAIALLVFGVKSWLLWGFVMIILSIIPLVGAWMVLIPAGLVQLLYGNIWQGVGIIIFSLFVVSNVDNLIRPRLVGREAKLHDLVIFFSSIGGIAAFGVMGFIVGPVIASLFISVLDIYSIEFEHQLETENRS